MNKLVTAFTERLRCLKHNLLDSMSFKIYFKEGYYHVLTKDNIKMRFKHNAFLPFVEITCGYLRNGEWDILPGDYVIDAGSYLGEFAIYASRKVGPTGRVFVFEPDAANVSSIKEMFQLNGGLPENVEILQKGLWSNSGSVTFQTNMKQSSKIVDGEALGNSPAQNVISVDVESVDSFSNHRMLPKLDFIKMDIEGAEIEAVNGSVSALKKYKPRFSIASYHLRDHKQTCHDLEQMFNDNDYLAETGFPLHKTTYGYPKSYKNDATSAPVS